ncbi:THO complex subunit 1 transcription elongation factor-domain-containing protein [Desarmillaria tabescens]|uniref:THO complex subunit 1 transcription elongation factor-domain-containing protein n=1 Tax=Armillaria tabescens TaxID=1929756 RepID=A0AA39U3G3_ARMTA|nr:THO complex subunit 1 transcription elongation factor-domain-containing protein [Desarmillaria tabescens]KAK0466275.1 THO complex subunit 1 transcription elongation factor-domain-containing protein [Desarmillaria tabescens]
MVSLQPTLTALLKSLPPPPVKPDVIKDNILKAIKSEKQVKISAENKRVQWEYLLKNEIFKLAETEGKASKEDATAYYTQLQHWLDLVLTFSDLEICDPTFTFIILQDLLETQTITSCSHIFSWIESRAPRLTAGMVPQKGKSLYLLRTLNDLLRRLSKMGSTTMFCGRILTFLSGAFPLSERSGVNLRGEYGPTWEGVKDMSKREEKEKEGNGETKDEKTDEDDKMQVDDDKPASTTQADDFYQTFWSLQLPFSKPPLFSDPSTFPAFKDSVDKVLPVLKEATAKERVMMGSRTASGGAGSLKRKREPQDIGEETVTDYFFAKFLTSPDLLDLELKDTHFRRQFLFQLLILLSHLLTFVKSTKEKWATVRNRSLHMDFTLEAADIQWVQETFNKTMEELRQTTPNGRAFADTVSVILDREKNWIKWKNELCAPFDKAPWSTEVNGATAGFEEATKLLWQKMREPPEDWKWKYGSEYLTDVWEMGYRDLDDLAFPFKPGEVKDFVKRLKFEDVQIERRKRQLAQQAERAAALAASQPTPAPVPPKTPETAPVSGTESTLRPAPVATPTNSSLHPSLPAKPVATPTPKPAQDPQPAPVSIPEPSPVPPPTVYTRPSPPTDPKIIKYEENKQRIAWLALRAAREQHLNLFGKIGTGDIELLVEEIEAAKQKETVQLLRDVPPEDTGSASPLNVLVTGGAGYIGSHVVYCLQKTRRYKVISIDNGHNSLPEALVRVGQLSREELPPDASEQDIQSTEIDIHNVDLTKAEEVRAVFEKYGKGGIWGVIHIAAYKAVGESTEIPLTYYQNNVSATISLLQIMSEFECYRLVYSSSATVYGTPPIVPIPETTRLQAHSPYGKTKVMAETIIDDLCHAEPEKWQALSLRYFNPAGAHPSGRIGEDPKGRPGNLLPLLAHMAVGRVKESVLKVFGNDYPTRDGTCVRDYLHVLDLASGHLLALDTLNGNSQVFHDRPNGRFKAYNLGKGRGMSVLEIVEAMRAATGFNYQTEIIGRRRGDVPDLTADPSLAEKELGFKAPQDLETMCRDLWNWQSKNPQGYGEQ